jgi:hypothetical protein
MDCAFLAIPEKVVSARRDFGSNYLNVPMHACHGLKIVATRMTYQTDDESPQNMWLTLGSSQSLSKSTARPQPGSAQRHPLSSSTERQLERRKHRRFE